MHAGVLHASKLIRKIIFSRSSLPNILEYISCHPVQNKEDDLDGNLQIFYFILLRATP